MRVPDDLCKILRSYSQNWDLVYETEVDKSSIRITAGVLQGSIHGHTLWNALYNDMLTLKLLKGVGFADDTYLTVSGETPEEVEMLATEAINMIRNWVQDTKLRLTSPQTEATFG